MTPAGYSLRSQVNGYGGGALCAFETELFGVNAETQQIDRIDPETGAIAPLTRTDGARYGGLVADPVGTRVLAVREWLATAGREPGQELVAVALDGRVTVLHAGADFYSAPAVSADGRHLAWVSWALPAMPWQVSTLWLAEVGRRGELLAPMPVPTPEPASVQQPTFAGSRLWVLSDHGGWWQPYEVDGQGREPGWLPLTERPADHANAPWQLAESHHRALPDGGWARVCYHQGVGELWLSAQAGATPRRVAPECVDFRGLQVYRGRLYALASRVDTATCVVALDTRHPDRPEVMVLAGGERLVPATSLSRPRPFQLPGERDVNGPVASGFYYPPATPASSDPPPLIVNLHGGPTSAAYPAFNPQIQFWCQQGFAVAEVNYRGSSGAGRACRLALAGQWGCLDVEDAIAAADHLVDRGLADRRRLFIQGRSAGGYTALMAMVRSNRFRAGASLFGVSDPGPLRAQTHRFESGYLDWLLGDPRQHPQRWRARTPVLQAHRIRGPVVFFQGGRDSVVVPEQTERMAAAMAQAGVPAEVHLFPEEGHGFRLRRNQAAMLAKLLAFYRQQWA
ncbi:MAG: prolyl oligopeptidase family serine peptidase [Marinobacter sp.]|uniref:S9 family peptidase n=1 Tax=Marinobacter sp. TaxID=50741 RepID=UPI00299D5EF1|nr:prolyl oligopeptidase family serine peptidase [Marinobacter sp.]MDX1756804.1 prolyl oligopeptidase family serine peptidase [Marinobacter sp.]